MRRSFQTSVSSLGNWESESVAQRRVSQKRIIADSWLLIFSGSYCWKRDRLYSTYMQQLMMKHDACIISGIKSFNCFDKIVCTIIHLNILFFRYENLARVSESFICVRIEAIINFLLYTVLYTNMSLSVEHYAAVKFWIDAVKVSAKEVSCSVVDQLLRIFLLDQLLRIISPAPYSDHTIATETCSQGRHHFKIITFTLHLE